MRAEKFKMASKMAAEFKRAGLSLGSLQWIFVNRMTVKKLVNIVYFIKGFLMIKKGKT